MIRQSLAWFLYDARLIGGVALLHWAIGKPIPVFYRGRPVPSLDGGLR